jgi:hypothetical protein
MANTKMFVHYSKTKAEFIAAGLATTYNNSIVFIKGDANGNGSCIYTHGTYFANFAELIAAVNYVKGVNVGGQNYNAAAGGGYLAFSASDPSTVAVNAGQNGITIGLTQDFINTVNNTASLAGATSTALGAKTDTADAEGSAFARIAQLAAAVAGLQGSSTGSVADQIAAAVNALKGTLDTDDATTLAAINDELNAIDAKWADYVTNAALAAIEGSDNAGDKVKVTVASKGGKVTEVSVDETGLTGALNLKANAADVYTKTDAEAMAQGKVDALANGSVKANTDAIAKLNGNYTVEGSVDKKIQDAINAFAGSADGDSAIENVTELLNYVSGVDGSKDLASAIAQIADNKGKIETLNGDANTAGSVAKAVADEASLRENADNAINGRIDALAAVVGAPESDVEATGIFKVIEENEKTTANALTNLDTRLQDVESKKDSIESALQASDITTGGANGTISVKGSDVKVKGLGSAAYTEASAYATSAQGAKADTAYQKPTAGIPASDLAFAVYTQAEVNAMWAWEEL